MNQQRLSLEVLKDSTAPAIALVAVALQKYDTSCMEWQPELLRDELQSDYNITISDLQSDKLQAGLTILHSDFFEAQWEVFSTICHLLNGTPDRFEDATPLEAEELAAALAHYHLILGLDSEAPKFSDEVKAYAGQVFSHYGMSEAPAIFPQALMPDGAQQADPTEKNQALSAIYDERKARLTAYMHSLRKE